MGDVLRQYVRRILTELHVDKEVRAALKGIHTDPRKASGTRTPGSRGDPDTVIDAFLGKRGKLGDEKFEKKVVSFVKDVWPRITKSAKDGPSAERELYRKLQEKFK